MKPSFSSHHQVELVWRMVQVRPRLLLPSRRKLFPSPLPRLPSPLPDLPSRRLLFPSPLAEFPSPHLPRPSRRETLPSPHPGCLSRWRRLLSRWLMLRVPPPPLVHRNGGGQTHCPPPHLRGMWRESRAAGGGPSYGYWVARPSGMDPADEHPGPVMVAQGSNHGTRLRFVTKRRTADPLRPRRLGHLPRRKRGRERADPPRWPDPPSSARRVSAHHAPRTAGGGTGHGARPQKPPRRDGLPMNHSESPHLLRASAFIPPKTSLCLCASVVNPPQTPRRKKASE
jgi:hypothetical protein